MNSSDRSPRDATLDGQHASSAGHDRARFHPVALPALAAAVHIGATAARDARSKLAAHWSATIVHEDEPTG